MKKYIALILAVIIMSGVLASCADSVDGGALVTDLAGKNYAALTEQDGNVKRDEAGNLVVLVTDAKGRSVTNEAGEKETNVVGLNHALVVGSRIECKYFAMNIPEGWSDNKSFSDLIIKRDGTQDQIVISFFDDTSLAEKTEERLRLYDSIKSTYAETGKFNRFEAEIGGQAAAVYEGFVVPQEEGASPVYLAYYFFEYGGIVYSCYVNSDRDLTGNEEIAAIIDTIEFI